MQLSDGVVFAFRVLLAAGALALAFCAGVNIGRVEFEPEMRTVIGPTVECRLVESHTVQYVERPVAVVRDTGSIRSEPAELRHFENLEELRQWLAVAAESTATVYFQPPGGEVDCDDYALALQSRALADGFIVSFEIIGRDEYNSLFSGRLPPGQDFHAINLAIIGNDAFYIESQTGEVIRAVSLD